MIAIKLRFINNIKVIKNIYEGQKFIGKIFQNKFKFVIIKLFDFGWHGEDVVFIIIDLQTSLIKVLDIFGPPSDWIWMVQLK